MTSESILTSRDKSSAFSPFQISSSEKTPFSSGIHMAPAFACPQSLHSSYPYLSYPSLLSPARFFGQEYGVVPLLDVKGVVQQMGSFLQAAPVPGMFGYHPIEEEKPSQSYIGLIGKAILSTPHKKLVLSDIYNYILTNYPYFRNKGPGWRNSIRHNLSLNECFIKVGRSPNGKGHFWAINPSNYEDFSKGEYRRKRASKKRTSAENFKLKFSEKERGIAPKIDAKFGYTKAGAPSTGALSAALYRTCPALTRITNKTKTVKENKGFHIETLLSETVADQYRINSCFKRKDTESNDMETVLTKNVPSSLEYY